MEESQVIRLWKRWLKSFFYMVSYYTLTTHTFIEPILGNWRYTIILEKARAINHCSLWSIWHYSCRSTVWNSSSQSDWTLLSRVQSLSRLLNVQQSVSVRDLLSLPLFPHVNSSFKFISLLKKSWVSSFSFSDGRKNPWIFLADGRIHLAQWRIERIIVQ